MRVAALLQTGLKPSNPHLEEVLRTRPEERSFAMNAQLASALENAWIEIFRAGDYADRGRWSERDLDQIAASYNPRLHAAPVVLGHPQHDAPAFAWVKSLRRAGPSLWAQLHQVDPAFEQLLRAGRFRTRSIALYTHFLPTRGPYLRHVGFLGAQPPQVKALSPVRFAESAAVAFAFENESTEVLSNPVAPATACSEDTMVEERAKLERPAPRPARSGIEGFLDHLRAFFTTNPASAAGRAEAWLPPSSGSGDESAQAESSGTAEPLPSNPAAPEPLPSNLAAPAAGMNFAEKIAQLEQRLDLLAEEKRVADQKLAASRLSLDHQQIETFIETLRARGKFPPVFERLGVRAFLEALSEVDAAREASSAQSAPQPDAAPHGDPVLVARSLPARLPDGPAQAGTLHEPSAGPDQPVQPPALAPSGVEGSLLAWFEEFLTRLPAVIHFGELAADTGQGTRGTAHDKLVRFTEPQRGVTIDPASVELAERAQALAADLGISYADALARLRDAHRAAHSTA